jgi:hypothetical protein
VIQLMFKQAKWIVLLTGISLMLWPSLVWGQQSNDGQWSAPLFLGDGWWQSIAIDRAGDVHVGWYGSEENPGGIAADVMDYARRSLDGTWTPVNDVLYTGLGGFTIRSSLSVTSDGMLHAVFRSNTQHRFASAYTATADNVRSWSEPVVIDDTGYYVNMLADSKDILHVVTSERLVTGIQPRQTSIELNPCALCQDLFYRRSTDGGVTWSEPYPLSLVENSGNDRMEIFEGQSGRIYIDWDEGLDWYLGRGTAQDVRLVYSDDNGVTWSKPIILDGGNFVDRHPIQIAVTELRDESLLAVWRYDTNTDRNIYYQISRDIGQTWTEPQPIPGFIAQNTNKTGLDDYALVTDKIGIAHLFAVGVPDLQTTTNSSLYHVTFREGLWTPPQRVFYSNDMQPEWPKVVIGLQNDIHLVWFIRGTGRGTDGKALGATDILKVYYSHLPGVFPLEATQAYSPTKTPLPTATVFQSLESTPTPFPTVQIEDASVTLQTQDQYASKSLLGGLVAATAFCAVVLVLVRIRRGG